MRKGIITLGIIALGVCSAGTIKSVNAAADIRGGYGYPGTGIYFDEGYTGPIDPITGEPLLGDDGEEEQKNEVATSGGAYYNRTDDMYIYTFDTGKVECSVADGMIVTGDVDIKVKGGNVVLYKDGNKVTDIPETITSAGSYMFVAGDNNNKSQIMGFRVVKKRTGVLNQYVMPEGFYVDTVSIDGVEQNTGYSMVDMTAEGYYEIHYINSDTEHGYTLKVTVDHTPPQVTFKGVDKNNKAKGPVTVKGLEEDDTVKVTYNGEKGSLDMYNRVKESGKYTIVVTDSAGNSVEKTFTILIYLNLSSSLFIAIILAIIVGVCIALYVTRKRLRVR